MLPLKNWCAKHLIIRFLFVWMGAVWVLSSCDEDIMESPVPERYVSYSCNIHTVNVVMEQDKGQTQLESPGGYVRIWEAEKLTASDAIGLGGLLLLHNFEDTGYFAFDLTCPYCYLKGGTSQEKMQRIVVKEDGFTAQCLHCQSEFGAVYWGSPASSKGPANEENRILRQYKAVLVGDILTVTR